jgi:hypothetical protein
MDADQARRVRACLPSRLHPFSQEVLDLYLGGDMPTSEFRRWFHMPNSDYLSVSDCVAQIVDPNYIPEAQLPAAVTLIVPQRI